MTNEQSRTNKQQQKKTQPPVPVQHNDLESESPSADSHGIQFQSGDDRPSVQQVADKVQRTWGKEARQRSFSSVQRQLGNKAAAQVAAEVTARGVSNHLIQRHPPGADLVPQAPGVEDEVDQARGGREVPSPSGDEGTTAQAPEAPSPAGPTAEGETPEPAPAPVGPEGEADTTPEAEPTAEGETPAEGESTTAPAPVLSGTMTSAFAQEALTEAYGDIAGEIVPGNITVVSNLQELYAAYDQWCIDNNVAHSDGSAWAVGDAAASDRASGTRMGAFAEPEPGTNIWVDASFTDPTATVHEMLHINTASGFRAAVGEIVNEGTTQRLAVRAVQQAGESVAGSENTYQREQEVVQAIADIVGDETVTNAYFGGADTLISQYNEIFDDDNAWATLKALLDANDFASALTLLRDNAAQGNIHRINELLWGWVSDEDLAGIQEIYDGSSADIKTAIRTAIEPRTHEVFWRSRTRRRVREIIEAT